MKKHGWFFIVAVLSVLYGGGMVVLFAHAVNKQQIIMQEGE